MTSDESQDAMRIFATSPLDRDVIMYRETGGHRPRTDSNSSASSQDRFKIGAFAGPFMTITVCCHYKTLIGPRGDI